MHHHAHLLCDVESSDSWGLPSIVFSQAPVSRSQSAFIPLMMVMLFLVPTAHCWDIYSHVFCSLSIYWERGFVALQTAINAAIIEVSVQVESSDG